MTGDRPPAPTLSETERAEAFRRTEPKIPPRFALLVVGLAAVLGVAGVIGERVISGIGLNPSSAATRWASRLPPRTVLLIWVGRPLSSRPVKTRTSQTPG